MSYTMLMLKKNIYAAVQVAFGALGLTAIGVQLYRHISFHYSVVNFFSYFTNLSNIFAAFVLITGGVLTYRSVRSARYDYIRGASVLCMAVVGIVFSLLLRSEDLGTLLPWVNFVLHYLMTVAVVVLWFVLPPRTRLTARSTFGWLIVPTCYLMYSLVRGAQTDWYAYPFLNPSKVGGYLGVTGYCVGILILFIGLGWLLARLIAGRRHHSL